MTTLLKAVFAALLVSLLFASPSHAAGLDEWNDLIGQVNALMSETRELDAQLSERFEEVSAIDPAGTNAADALPVPAEAQVVLDKLSANA